VVEGVDWGIEESVGARTNIACPMNPIETVAPRGSAVVNEKPKTVKAVVIPSNATGMAPRT
jgi:hypothetical protein